MRPVPSELGRGRLSRFGVSPGGWVFYLWGGEGCRGLACCLVAWRFVCGAGEGCRVLVCCVVVSLVRAEAPVPSVATSGCPKRSEGGCPCRSEEAHRPSSVQHGCV